MQRLEDPAILTGRGRYGDDIAVKPGTLHAAVLRSPHAHAELASIDASVAEKLPGVRAAVEFLAQHVARHHGSGSTIEPRA